MMPAIKDAPKKAAKPQPTLPGGFAGQILRVDLAKRKCWGEPWGSPSEMRDQRGGGGRGSRRPSKETREGRGCYWLGRGQYSLLRPPSPRPRRAGACAG